MINKPNEEMFKELYRKEEEFLTHEIPERPSDINYRLKNAYYTVDYLGEECDQNEEFLAIYREILDTCVSSEVRKVMELYFDCSGRQLLTDEEISEITGFNILKVSMLRKTALKILRNDKRSQEYLQKKLQKRKTTIM